MVAKYNETEGVYLGIWPLSGSNEIEVAHRLRDEMERIRPTLPKDIDMQLVWDGTMFMRNALTEITKTLVGDDPDRRAGGLSLHGLGAHRAGAARRDAGLAGRSGDLHVRVRLQPQSPDAARDRAVGRAGRGRRDRRRRERRAARAPGQVTDRGGADRRARAARPDHRHDDHAGRGLRADRLPGRPDRLAVPGVRDHAGRGGRAVGHRRGHAVAGHEFAIRPSAGQGRPADRLRQPTVRRGAPRVRLAARRRAGDALGHRGGFTAHHGRGVAAVHVLAAGTRSRGGSEPHQPVLRSVAGLHGGRHQPRASADRQRPSRPFPKRNSRGR